MKIEDFNLIWIFIDHRVDNKITTIFTLLSEVNYGPFLACEANDTNKNNHHLNICSISSKIQRYWHLCTEIQNMSLSFEYSTLKIGLVCNFWSSKISFYIAVLLQKIMNNQLLSWRRKALTYAKSKTIWSIMIPKKKAQFIGNGWLQFNYLN